MKSRFFLLVVLAFSVLIISSSKINTDSEKSGNILNLQTSNYCECKSKPDYYVEVPLREIYVTVKDENGKHIKDLKPEEFMLWENGVEQKILAVDKVEFKTTETEASKNIEINETPNLNVRSNSKPKRYFTLLIGNMPDLEVEKNKSRDAIRNFINNNVGPDDYLSLYIINLSSLDLIVPFNIDPQQSKTDILKYLENGILGGKGFKSMKRGNIESNMLLDYGKIDDTQIKNMEFLSVAKLLKSFCKGLQYIRGKKDIIVFSEGFFFSPDLSKEMRSMPAGISSDTSVAASLKVGPTSASMYSALLDLKKTFVESDISLQVIDLGKLSLLIPDIADNRSSRIRNEAPGKGGSQDDEDIVLPTSNNSIDQNSPLGLEFARITALLTLSSSTGGRFYKYSNSKEKIIKDLDSVDYDTSFYYILSYTSSNTDTKLDEYLPIDVLVSRDDVKLRYKKGIIINKSIENLDEIEQNAQLNFIAQSSNLYNMISICASIAVIPAEANKSNIVCAFQVPLKEIMGEDKKGDKVDMDIFINIFNIKNEFVAGFNRRVNLNIPKDNRKKKNKDIALYYSALMTAGEYRVKLFIRNRANMMISSEEFKVNVPDFSGPGLRLGSPLIYTETPDILKLELVDEEKAVERKSVFSYLPGVYFISNEAKNSKKIKIGIAIKGLTTDELKAKGNQYITWEAVKTVREELKKEQPQNLEYKIEDIIEKPDNILLTLFELDIRDLPEGDFDTIITARKNEMTASSSIRLHLI
jgi:VWFA-related protein